MMLEEVVLQGKRGQGSNQTFNFGSSDPELAVLLSANNIKTGHHHHRQQQQLFDEKTPPLAPRVSTRPAPLRSSSPPPPLLSDGYFSPALHPSEAQSSPAQQRRSSSLTRFSLSHRPASLSRLPTSVDTCGYGSYDSFPTGKGADRGVSVTIPAELLSITYGGVNHHLHHYCPTPKGHWGTIALWSCVLRTSNHAWSPLLVGRLLTQLIVVAAVAHYPLSPPPQTRRLRRRVHRRQWEEQRPRDDVYIIRDQQRTKVVRQQQQILIVLSSIVVGNGV